MSNDTAPFVPPESYPSPPTNMGYELPKGRPAPRTQQPPVIFPWESNRPQPSRTFAGESPQPAQQAPGETMTSAGSDTSTKSFTSGSSRTDTRSVPSTPTTPTIKVVPSDPWTTFTRTNAWDEVPQIERYVEGLQKHRHVKGRGSVGSIQSPTKPSNDKDGHDSPRLHGLKLTDFPSEVERPSLPVTPAPIRRPTFWGGGGPESDDKDGGGGLTAMPSAEGVPAQYDWVCVHG